MNKEDITVENVKHFIEGNANHLLDKIGLLPEQVKSQVENRIATCHHCSFAVREDNKLIRCGICLCSLPEKAYSLKSSCPKGYWLKIEKQ